MRGGSKQTNLNEKQNIFCKPVLKSNGQRRLAPLPSPQSLFSRVGGGEVEQARGRQTLQDHSRGTLRR